MSKARRIAAAAASMESTEARATRQVLEERAGRVKRCSEELNALLTKHRCTVEITSSVIQIVGQAGSRTVCAVNVVPLELAGEPLNQVNQVAPRDPVAG